MSTPAEVAPATARNSVTVAGWTLASRVTGLLRVLVIGAVLGPTYFANLFQTGYVVPQMVYSLIAGQVLAMVVVPTVVRAVADGGLPRAREVLGRVAGVLLVASGTLAVLLALAAPLVAWSLTFGIPDGDARARARELTIVVILFVAPQVVLYTVAALSQAAQQARGRFALAAGAPIVENLGVMATMGCAGWLFGGGPEVTDVPLGYVVVLCAGATGSVAAHAALQVLGAYRAGVGARPSLRWREDPHVVDMVHRVRRSVSVAACPSAALYVVLALAATVPGGVFVIQVVYAVNSAVISLGAHAVSTAVLPELSRAAGGPDTEEFAAAWRRGMSYAAVAGLPALVLIVVFANPAANVLAAGEADSETLIHAVAACLLVIAVVQLVGGVHGLGRQALFARLDDLAPRIAVAVGLAVVVAVGLASLTLPAGTPRLVGLAAALLAGEAAGALIVLRRLRVALRPRPLFEVRSLAPVMVAVLPVLPVAVAGSWLMRSAEVVGVAEAALLALCGAVAVAVYAAALRLTTGPRAGVLENGAVGTGAVPGAPR
ncbi:MAG: lipid II flippase MurJ [Pseudonocardiaceae bacterium]